jgi:hypothetical protein
MERGKDMRPTRLKKSDFGFLRSYPSEPHLPLEADDGSRTRDLELGKLALYQLSYVRAGR